MGAAVAAAAIVAALLAALSAPRTTEPAPAR
jgi:hypothetical protein